MGLAIQKKIIGALQSIVVLSNSNIFVLILTLFSAFKISSGIVSKRQIILSYLSTLYFSMHALFSIGYFGVETKIIIIGLILGFIALSGRVTVSSHQANSILFIFMIYTALCIATTFPIIFRFSDHTTLPLKLMSVYFGVSTLIVVALTDSKFYKLIGMILIPLCGSGTAMLGLLVYICSNIKLRNIIPSIIVISIVLVFFVINQIERNRLDGDWLSIDRLVITVTTLNYMYQTMSPFQWLVGTGINNILPDYYYVLVATFSEIVSGYLESEGFGSGSGRIFHSEHLRLLFHVGIFGWMFIWYFLFKVLEKTKLFMPFFVMSFFGSVPLISSIFILLLVFTKKIGPSQPGGMPQNLQKNLDNFYSGILFLGLN